ncbi:hypothetical protein GQ457_17G002080 [Hibiscus cannabinus]
MAAGKNGGYHTNGFRNRDSEFEETRREFGNSKDHESSRNDSRNDERLRVREARDRVRVRQKDTKKREVVNGDNRSSLSISDSGGSAGGSGGSRGPRRCGLSLRVVDKEPGELSSESGSEDAIESESVVKNTEVAKAMDNGAQSPVGKKRKFSPIVWNIDDKELSSASKCRKSPAVTTFPPISSIDLDLSPPKEQVSNQDAGQLEDEDYVPTRHISSSRWASGDSSPGDEGEILEDEEIPKTKKKLSLSESVHGRSWNKSATPELGELNREGSDAIRARSSESNERAARSRSGSGDDYPGNHSEKDDYIEIDIDRDRNDGSVRESHTDSENENDSPGTPEPPAPPLRSVNMLQGCRSVDEFERLNKIDEVTYGVVYRARDKKTGEIVALKKVKMEKEREGFPLTSLREINILLSFHHPSIVDVKEVVLGSNLDSIFMVMEYMEHDLKGLMETMKQPFSQSEVKCLMLQLLEGVKYLHDNWVLHPDLKTSNLLLNNQGVFKLEK